MMKGVAAFTIAALAASAAPRAQTGASFEVASIKPNKSGPGAFTITAPPGGRFTATNVTLRALIQNAYGTQALQVSGGPGWIATDQRCW